MSEDDEQEKGLKAIAALLEVLGPLKAETRSNVLDYVFRALGIASPVAASPTPLNAQPAFAAQHYYVQQPNLAAHGTTGPVDIRSLTDQKKPKTVNQMVAIMAYYLAAHAPQAERRDHIVADDIKRYFPQANFPLPTGRPDVSLNNAKVAGYLDSIGDGQYRLNPVGHNLVVHKLPQSEGGSAPAGRVKRKSKKARKAKKVKARK
jgi:hypothetical protein